MSNISELSDSEDESISMPLFTPARTPTFNAPLIPPSMKKLRHFTGLLVRNIRFKESHFFETPDPIPKLDDNEVPIPFPSTPIPKKQQSSEPSPKLLLHHRRRSIRDLSSEYDSGMAFQRYLEGVIDSRLLSVFFTIHIKTQEEPIYVSEIIHNTANPQFRDLEPENRNENEFIISLWGKSTIESNYKLLFSNYIHLPDLKFIGSSSISLSKCEFPSNSLVIVLCDGYYVVPDTFKMLKSTSIEISSPDTSTQPSLSFDQILKLANLQACIADASKIVNNVEEENTQKILKNKESMSLLLKKRNELKNKLQNTQNIIQSQKLKNIEIQRSTRETNLLKKQTINYISSGAARQKSISMTFKEINDTTTLDKTVIMDQYTAINLQHSRVFEDICCIFPISPIPGLPLKFTICGLPFIDTSFLPKNPEKLQSVELWVKTVFKMEIEDVIGAVYGFAAQLVVILSYYLCVPLRYPIQPFGSQSFIIDPISAIQGSRTFPLWTKGSLYFRFQYGAFLFNKNVEQLLDSQEIMMADTSQVMANLQNLILILSTKKY